MSVVTATAHRPGPMSPPARRRLLWATVAFTLGAISGAGATLAVEDDPSSPADVGVIESDVTGQSATPGAGTPSGSADAIERAALRHQRAETAGCSRRPTSADAAERCVAAAG